MWGRSDAARCKIEYAWVGLRMGDEFGNCLGRKRRMHRHDEWSAHHARDRNDISDEIEAEFVEEHGVDDVSAGYHEKCVPVRGCAHHRLGTDVVAAARPVL